MACDIGADLVINTDTHSPNDLISYDTAYKIALGAGLPDKVIKKALKDNPMKILRKKGLL